MSKGQHANALYPTLKTTEEFHDGNQSLASSPVNDAVLDIFRTSTLITRAFKTKVTKTVMDQKSGLIPKKLTKSDFEEKKSSFISLSNNSEDYEDTSPSKKMPLLASEVTKDLIVKSTFKRRSISEGKPLQLPPLQILKKSSQSPNGGPKSKMEGISKLLEKNRSRSASNERVLDSVRRDAARIAIEKSIKQKKLEDQTSKLQKATHGFFMKLGRSNNTQRRSLTRQNTMTSGRKAINFDPFNIGVVTIRLFKSIGLKPDTRELATMSLWNRKLVLFGGMSNRAHPFVHRFDIKTRHWVDEEHTSDKIYPQCYRLGHTADIFNNLLLIFGGEMRDPHSKHSLMTNDFLVYSLERNEWRPDLKPKNKSQPCDRRDHLSFISGTELYIFGGHQGNHKEHCTDLYKLDVTNLQWKKVSKPHHYFFSEGISGTTVVPVNPYDGALIIRGIFSILNTVPSQKNINMKSVQMCGYYIFGGMTNTGVTNRLTVIDTSSGSPKFSMPFISGEPPPPRFLHSTHYLESKSLLAIIGGKTSIGESLDRDLDVFVLELVDMRWVRVQLRNGPFPTMCAHAAANDEERIYIFGGIDKNNYRENDLSYIEIENEHSGGAHIKHRDLDHSP